MWWEMNDEKWWSMTNYDTWWQITNSWLMMTTYEQLLFMAVSNQYVMGWDCFVIFMAQIMRLIHHQISNYRFAFWLVHVEHMGFMDEPPNWVWVMGILVFDLLLGSSHFFPQTNVPDTFWAVRARCTAVAERSTRFNVQQVALYTLQRGVKEFAPTQLPWYQASLGHKLQMFPAMASVTNAHLCINQPAQLVLMLSSKPRWPKQI